MRRCANGKIAHSAPFFQAQTAQLRVFVVSFPVNDKEFTNARSYAPSHRRGVGTAIATITRGAELQRDRRVYLAGGGEPFSSCPACEPHTDRAAEVGGSHARHPAGKYQEFCAR